MNPRYPLLGVALLAMPTLGLTQVAGPYRIEVSATPIVDELRIDAFGALRTEVGETQVRELNAIDLSSALRRTPGVTVSRFNPVGSFGGDEGGAVYVRGLGATRPGSEIKTYVDGLPFYMGVWNHSLLDLLPIQGMERLSVHKGPQPQQFGNTFAAVDLTPRRVRADGLSANLRLTGGGHDTFIEQADLAWRGAQAEFSLVQGHARSDGHRPDADGRLDNALASGSVQLAPGWRVGALLLGADNAVRDPGVEGDPTTKTGRFATRGSLAQLWLAHTQDTLRGRLQLYGNQGSSDWDNPNAALVHSRFKLSGLRWRETLEPWAGAELHAGLDIDRMAGSVAFNGFTAFDGQSLRLTAPQLALAQTVALGGGWTATPSAGVRLYRHNVYGSHSAPHAGLVLAQGEVLQLRLNAARGLNFPGLDAALLNAIVPPLGASPEGWRALKPERMDHVEAGVHWQPARDLRLDLSVFHDQLDNRYVFAFPPAVALPSFTNLGSYRMQGAEATWQQTWSAAVGSFVGLTWLDPSRADLPYAPTRMLSAGFAWQTGPWRLSTDAQAQSRMLTLSRARADGAANTAAVGGFAVVNLRGSLALPVLGPRGEVFMAIENLGDRRYGYRPGYPMPGRTLQAGVNLSL